MEKDEVELITVRGRNNEKITVTLEHSYAERLRSFREDGLNVDNFTKKCHQYALEQSFSDKNFGTLLAWWLHNIDNDSDGNGICRYLNDSKAMDRDDPWIINRIGYAGNFEPFKNIVSCKTGKRHSF